ncbi:MAG: glycoside hydrolase family 31 protein [Armatimonadota bacterium]
MMGEWQIRQTDRGLAVRRDNETLRIEFCTPGILRIRKYDTPEPPESLLMRYGFYRDDWDAVEVNIDETADVAVVKSELLSARLTADGRVEVHDSEGQTLLEETEPATLDPDASARFSLPEDRGFFGLGDETRDHIEHRGYTADLWVRNVTGYIPIPFITTSDGFGLLLNTTRRTTVDLGDTSDDRFGFDIKDGVIDYYVIYGPTLPEIYDRYTDITYKPPMPPKWAFGLWFICNMYADAHEFVSDAHNFRREEIPCDTIALEPGWMDTFYDYSTEKDWHSERFPVAEHARYGRNTFLRALERMGFKPGLWLCCDYDLTYEEERRRGREIEGDDFEAAFAEGAEVDEHFTTARYLDDTTKPEEPWFEHLQDFVDQGVKWFKQDGAMQVIDHPDRLWAIGETDATVHNIYPLMYSRQMYEGYREHTGQRPFVFTPGGWAGLQAYCGTWTGDTGGEEGPAAGCLNLSLSGHGMTTCDMAVCTLPGIHFGMLMPWSQINSFAYWRHPWLLGDRLEPIFKYYDRLRYRLIPYLYSTAWEAHRTGMPIMRAMPIEYTDDRETWDTMRQYMLGPNLMVGVFTDEVYLPEGEWINFWTGERLSGGRWTTPEVPENRGGPLLVKAGGILPMGPDIQYVGQKPLDELTIHVFAGANGEFTLYEDDGTTFAYEQGEYRTTHIAAEMTNEGLNVTIAAAEGDFEDAPQEREITLILHLAEEPAAVSADGQDLSEWEWDDAESTVTVELGCIPADEAVEVFITQSA